MNTDDSWPEPRRGRGGEYWRSRPSCTNGQVMTPGVVLTISTTSSATPLSWSLPGSGSGATKEHGRPGSMG